MKNHSHLIHIVLLSSALLFSGQSLATSNNTITTPATTACSDKDSGDACEFETTSGETINGFCKHQGSTQNTLVCVPIQN